jgi:RNA polymerase sigma factor (sigma-70 family)
VRRYRAERLLRDEFERLRDSVIGSVCGRLRAAGVRLDASDVDVAYAQAWQGLYAATLEGQQIVNPSGWLALVTYRRAIDEHRARRRTQCAAVPAELEGKRGGGLARNRRYAAQEPDLAAELDDRTRLRQLFEALRGRLSAREQQAATLCYLQGLSRSEAAARMGVSESRMRKLMEGRDTRSPGVAGKVGALVETIRAGAWCEEQGSLMRGFAYGILDPGGERYRLALIHRDECPACRAYVLSLRGLAAVLPPVPLVLQLTLGASAATSVAGSGAVAASGAGAGTGAGVGTGAAAPTSAGALSASGMAGAAGAAGGGWWLAGPLGAKLAVGCLLALGVGAGCVAFEAGAGHVAAPAHRRHVAREGQVSRSTPGEEASAANLAGGRLRLTEPSIGHAGDAGATAQTPLASAARASREFGPERATGASGARSTSSAGRSAPNASTASVGPATADGTKASSSTVSPGSAASPGLSSSGVSAAEREFAPG